MCPATPRERFARGRRTRWAGPAAVDSSAPDHGRAGPAPKARPELPEAERVIRTIAPLSLRRLSGHFKCGSLPARRDATAAAASPRGGRAGAGGVRGRSADIKTLGQALRYRNLTSSQEEP